MLLKLVKSNLFKENQILFFSIIFCATTATLLEAFSIGTFLPIIQNIIGNTPTKTGGLFEGLIEVLNSFYPDNVLASLFILFGILNILRIFFSILKEIINQTISQKVKTSIQYHFFKKYAYADIFFHSQKKPGDLIYNMVSLPQDVSSLYLIIPSIITDIIQITLLSTFLAYLSPILLLSIFSLSLFFGLIAILIGGKAQVIFGTKTINAHMNLLSLNHELIGGFKDLICANASTIWIKKSKKEIQQYFINKMKSFSSRTIISKSIEGVFLLSVAIAGAYMAQKKSKDLVLYLPLAAVYLMAIFRVIPYVGKLINSISILKNYKYALDVYESAINEVTKTSNTLQHREKVTFFNKNISVKSLSFRYPKSQKLVLQDINLEINKNETLAIVGESGSGKSTLIDLILGLQTPSNGDIFIDETNLQSINLDSWRLKIGYVSQNPYIFNGTIAENISLGQDYSQEKMNHALSVSRIDKFINTLDDGIFSQVGERGLSLSGGQRQRICIARSIYKSPDLLIFDEATNSLDNQTEKEIIDLINSIKKDMTIIILAHRLETIQNADKIIVIDKGGIIESGKHLDLIDKKGSYYHLYNAHR